MAVVLTKAFVVLLADAVLVVVLPVSAVDVSILVLVGTVLAVSKRLLEGAVKGILVGIVALAFTSVVLRSLLRGSNLRLDKKTVTYPASVTILKSAIYFY